MVSCECEVTAHILVSCMADVGHYDSCRFPAGFQACCVSSELKGHTPIDALVTEEQTEAVVYCVSVVSDHRWNHACI